DRRVQTGTESGPAGPSSQVKVYIVICGRLARSGWNWLDFSMTGGRRLPFLSLKGAGTKGSSSRAASRTRSNGVVVLDGGATLPEGTAVTVTPCTSPVIRVSKHRRRVELPLVRSSEPGSVNRTGERIAEILDEEDAPARDQFLPGPDVGTAQFTTYLTLVEQ